MMKMPEKPAGYCVCHIYKRNVSLDFFENYDDAVEAIRRFVFYHSKLSVRRIRKMNIEQLMDEVDEITDHSETYLRSYIIGVQFQEKQGR